jgi:4-hydroxyphenylpyruvate dioxygenase
MVPVTETRSITDEGDFLQIKSIDHIHFWVGNARHAMYWWWKGMGFKPVAYSGLETGNRRFASYVLQSGEIRIVVSTPYSPSDEMAAHHLLHGDGVKIVALEVDDVARAYAATVARGAMIAWAPKEEMDEYGELRTAAIRSYGEVLHVFVDRSAYGGPFALPPAIVPC